jgi:hypothetical protein
VNRLFGVIDNRLELAEKSENLDPIKYI